MARELSAEMRQCIENCTNCHTICMEALTHCLEMGGKHAEASHLRLLMDCTNANICSTSAGFMLHGSDFRVGTYGVCAQACEKMADGDELMLRCAEICRRCAESCCQMSQMADWSAAHHH